MAGHQVSLGLCRRIAELLSLSHRSSGGDPGSTPQEACVGLPGFYGTSFDRIKTTNGETEPPKVPEQESPLNAASSP
jgi:hypothetical protein